MGKLWRVDKALEDSEGLRWVRKQLEPYEWSKVDWITVRRGWSEVSAFRGVCKLPWKGRGYRINCNVSVLAHIAVNLCISSVPQSGCAGRGRKCRKGTRVAVGTSLPVMVRASNGNDSTVPWS